MNDTNARLWHPWLRINRAVLFSTICGVLLNWPLVLDEEEFRLLTPQILVSKASI